MQQMYSQYWAQYAQMMQYGPAAMPPMFWPQPTPVPEPVSPAAAGNAAPANQNAAPAAPANQNVRLNAQGGVEDEEEEGPPGQWDWLDWAHGLARMCVIFTAVYFYASMSRLVLVLGFGFLAYLYNQGWLFQPQQRQRGAAPQQQQQQQPQQAAQPPAEPHQDRQEPQERPQEAGAGVEVADELHRAMDDPGVVPPPLQEPHPLRLAWTFVSSFFASLVPERLEQ